MTAFPTTVGDLPIPVRRRGERVWDRVGRGRAVDAADSRAAAAKRAARMAPSWRAAGGPTRAPRSSTASPARHQAAGAGPHHGILDVAPGELVEGVGPKGFPPGAAPELPRAGDLFGEVAKVTYGPSVVRRAARTRAVWPGVVEEVPAVALTSGVRSRCASASSSSGQERGVHDHARARLDCGLDLDLRLIGDRLRAHVDPRGAQRARGRRSARRGRSRGWESRRGIRPRTDACRPGCTTAPRPTCPRRPDRGWIEGEPEFVVSTTSNGSGRLASRSGGRAAHARSCIANSSPPKAGAIRFSPSRTTSA